MIDAENPAIFPEWNDGYRLYAPIGDPEASAKAANLKNHAKILAEAIPARSYAVGRNPAGGIADAGGANMDMQVRSQ